jgi:PKD repeat protein
VYYTDSTRTNWTYFSNGFPNVIVNELEIQYSSGKLRAATYGRGLWETNLHDPNSLAPLANFKGDTLKGCPGHSVQFTDMSTNNPTGWNWTFPGGNPSSSTLQNPLITYTTSGSYNNVTLVASNPSGSDSITKYSYIGTSPAVKPVTNPSGNVTICAANIWVDPSAGATYKWIPGGQPSSQLNVIADGTYQVIVTDMFGCADTSAPFTITLQPAIPTPTITVNADTLFCNPSSGYTYQWSFSGSPVLNGTQQSIVGTPGGSYFVTITNTSGCTKQSAALLLLGVEETNLAGISIGISPSPNNGTFTLDGMLEERESISVTILDVAGRMIYKKDLGTVSGKFKENFSLQLSDGIYFMELKTAKGNAVKKFVVK